MSNEEQQHHGHRPVLLPLANKTSESCTGGPAEAPSATKAGRRATRSASRCSISPLANSPPPSTRRRRHARARRRARRAAAARNPRARIGSDGSPGCLPRRGSQAAASRRLTPGPSSFEAARRTLLDQLKRRRLEGFGLDDRPAAVPAAGALVQLPARHAEGRSRPRARDRASGTAPIACSSIRRRSKHLGVIEGAEGGPRGSLLHEIDRTITSMGGRLLRALAAAAARRARADSRSPRRRRGFRVPRHRRAASCATRSRPSTTSSASSAAPRSAPPGRATSWRCSSRSPRCRACAWCSSEFQAPLVSSLVAELDDLADVRDALERDAHRRAAGARARRRLHPRRRRSRARRAARHQPRRQAADRRDGGSASARAPASPR